MITNKDYLSSIRKCYLFDGIEDEQLTEAIMLLNGRIRKIQKDEFIVRLGDDLQSAGLLLKGRIESSFQNESFDQITMHRFGGGYLFGEALVINDTKISPVQIRAVENCTILFINLKAIYLSRETSPLSLKLAENLIKSLAKKNLILNQKVRILSQKGLRDKIMIYLSTLPKDKEGFITVPFTQTALAEYLGVNRSALSREFGRMQDDGILVIDKNKMKVDF